MSEERARPRRCAKCGQKFSPTIERKMTCENCYGNNSKVSPYAEEPEPNPRKKITSPHDDSIFKRIEPSPVNTR